MKFYSLFIFIGCFQFFSLRSFGESSKAVSPEEISEEVLEKISGARAPFKAPDQQKTDPDSLKKRDSLISSKTSGVVEGLSSKPDGVVEVSLSKPDEVVVGPSSKPAGIVKDPSPAPGGKRAFQKRVNRVSENFIPEEEGLSYSWFFDSVKTRQELFLMPVYLQSQIYGSSWGLRFFTFPSDDRGYYGSISVLNRLFRQDFIFRSFYERSLSKSSEIRFKTKYSNYFQPYYGEGMQTRLEDREDLHAHRFSLDQRLIFKKSWHVFYGAEGSGIFRRELSKAPEAVLFLKGLAGYDSRDSAENTKEGLYYQILFGCAPFVLYEKGFCRAEGDFRSYFPVSKALYFALRGFAGTSLLREPTYSMAYTLGGSKVFRGFTDNRFRGSKIYFGQAELRADLWKEFLSGVLFFEAGEVSPYGEYFKGARWDYGLGLRLGIPPFYKIKLRADLGISDEGGLNFIVDFLQAF